MKKKLVRIFDKVIFKVLTLLGCAGLFAACYGVMEAEFIQGTVTDLETDTPIEGIQVTLKIGKYPLDTVYTNEYGRYHFEINGLDSVQVKAEDVDGKLNGGAFAPDSAVVNYYQKTIDFTLKRQEDTENH